MMVSVYSGIIPPVYGTAVFHFPVNVRISELKSK